MGLPRRFGSTCMCVTKKFTLRRRAARTLVKHFLIPITFSNVATIGCWASLRHEMMYGQLCPHRKICMQCAHHAFVRSTKSNNQQSPIETWVGYGDRTHKTSGFNKESTFGPSFGRHLIGKASNRPPAGLRPAGGPILRRFPSDVGQKSAPKCIS